MSDPATVLKNRTIVQIVPELDAGGVEQATIDVAAALVRAGARALVLSEGGRRVDELAAAGAEFVAFPAATKNPLKVWENAKALRDLLQRERADLLHARSRAPAWSALHAARRTGTPFVTTWAGAYSAANPVKTLYNSVMARGDAVIANSLWTKRRIVADHPWAEDRITVIHRGTDLTRFDPAAMSPKSGDRLRQAWGVPKGARVILVVARLTGWKGHLLLLDALSRLGPDTVAVFAGDAQGRDAYVAELRQKAHELGLSERMFLTGHVADIPAALMAADVVAVPSIEPEAFGRAAVEAQAMGIPVVVSDHGAVPETVLAPPEAGEAERTGWRVPPGDAAALAEALAAALGIRLDARSHLARRARAHVERHFSLPAMTDATLALYARLIDASGHPAGQG